MVVSVPSVDQHHNSILSIPSSTEKGEKAQWKKISWFEIRTWKSLDDYCHVQNRLKIRHTIVIYWLLLTDWSKLKTPSTLFYPPCPKQCRGTGNEGCGLSIISVASSWSLCYPAPCGVPPTGCHPSQTDPVGISHSFSRTFSDMS